MGLNDKGREIKGKLKKTAGKATDNRRMMAEGKAEEIKGKTGQAVDKMRRRATDHRPAL